MKKLLFLLLFSITFYSFGQIEDAWLFLKDKPEQATFLANPLTMLSQRALDRRNQQMVGLDSLDVPIHVDYYNQLKNEGNIIVLGKSKWLNAVHIQGTVAQINGLPPNFPFIKSIEFANKSLNSGSKKSVKQITPNHLNKFSRIQIDFNYGQAENQIKMLKGDFLHQQGLTGKDQIIAVIDAGFPNVNTLTAFKRIRDNNQILGGYNFADRNTNFYTRHNHGTHVLSTIAGYLEDEFVGTAPDASFYLFISEIAESETVLEETLWVEAAERADSLGVDVVNTSLGYTTFDNPKYSYTYADMDGKTTFISRGAEIAASRGILMVNSVGNSGNSSWKYMGAPADAPSVISVGAVDASGNIAAFSSFGPTADNRIKPEILAQGASASIINFSTGQVSTSNGTSFSGPIIAGLIACLNQHIPQFIKGSDKKNGLNHAKGYFNNYLKIGLFSSADKHNNPLDQYGYGIPNFELAQEIYYAQVPTSVDENIFSKFSIYPNPITRSFTLDIQDIAVNEIKLEIFNVLGKKVFEKKSLKSKSIDVSILEKGIYLLKIFKENQYKIVKLIKQ
ncbi:MAG: S8 family serine peptidase [Polaribacter sp.]